MKFLGLTPAGQQLQAQNTKTLLEFYRASNDRLAIENARLRNRISEYEDLARRANLMAVSQEEGISRLINDINIEIGGNDAA